MDPVQVISNLEDFNIMMRSSLSLSLWLSGEIFGVGKIYALLLTNKLWYTFSIQTRMTCYNELAEIPHFIAAKFQPSGLCNSLVSERSERDTYRGNTIENRGCLFIYLFVYMFGRTYVI